MAQNHWLKSGIFYFCLAFLLAACHLHKNQLAKPKIPKGFFTLDSATNFSAFFESNPYWHIKQADNEEILEEYMWTGRQSNNNVFSIVKTATNREYFYREYDSMQIYHNVVSSDNYAERVKPLLAFTPTMLTNLHKFGFVDLVNMQSTYLAKRERFFFQKVDSILIKNKSQILKMPAICVRNMDSTMLLWVLPDKRLPIILKECTNGVCNFMDSCFKIEIPLTYILKKGSKLNYRLVNSSSETYMFQCKILSYNADSIRLEVEGKFNGSYSYNFHHIWNYTFNSEIAQNYFIVKYPSVTSETENIRDGNFLFQPWITNAKKELRWRCNFFGNDTFTACKLPYNFLSTHQTYETYDENSRKLILYPALCYSGDCGFFQFSANAKFPILLRYSGMDGVELFFEGVAAE